ncbi:hypothetical protein [Pseudomonas oryzihabitans]|uniref:hypothetical protein n=1 Tax=Pseudomonas oryzihabitans TaxID=47885 RepID=UPI001239AFD2|nr:hypothetical protein [Pseudomonas oryzihabitans]QEU01852.1 hypothetical protein FOB65_00505 [Pseudomonas oryzihabitans]
MDFYLHDVSAFPFVALRSDRCPAGYGELWCQEMDALLDSNRLFVVAFEPETLNETAEDFRTRGIWFKKNRHLLPGRCAAMIAIVPSEEERAANADDMAKRSRGFSVLYTAMASFEAAEQATAELISNVRSHAS